MDRKAQWSRVCKTMMNMEKGNEKAMLTVSHSLRTRRYMMKLWGIESETNKSYIFIQILKSLSQDVVEAEGVNLLNNWIKQVSQSTQRGSLVAIILFDLWPRNCVTSLCMKLEGKSWDNKQHKPCPVLILLPEGSPSGLWAKWTFHQPNQGISCNKSRHERAYSISVSLLFLHNKVILWWNSPKCLSDPFAVALLALGFN